MLALFSCYSNNDTNNNTNNDTNNVTNNKEKKVEKFACEICNKIFLRKYNLIRHQKRKNICNKKENIKISFEQFLHIPSRLEENNQKIVKKYVIKNEKLSCEYCNIKFSRKDNLNRHILYRCKDKNIIIDKVK